MATFGALKAKVADDLVRTDLDTQIAEAVNEAIADYKTERFWFNEYRTDNVLEKEITTVNGTEWYDLTPGVGEREPLIVDLVVLIDGNTNYTLRRVSNAYIEGMYDNATEDNRPTLWALNNRKIRFWPTPNAAYTVRVLGTFIEPELSLNTDENAWTTHAFDLIRHSAVRRMRFNIIRDVEGGQVAEKSEMLALSRLRKETILRLGLGTIQPAWCD